MSDTATAVNGVDIAAHADTDADLAFLLDSASSEWAGPEGARVGSTWIHAPQQPESFVIEGRLPRNAVGFVGTGGTGKSTYLTRVAVHVILGRRVLGGAVLHPGPVVYVTAEDDTATVHYRLHEICDALDLSPTEWQEVGAHFYVEDVSAVSVRLVNEVKGAYEPSPAVNRLIDAYREVRPALVIIDPTSLLGPGEENANGGMGELMRTCRRISRELGCAVVLVHHETKAGARDGMHDQYAGRGGSAFADNARGMLQLVPLDALTFTHEKRQWACPPHWSQEDLEAGNLTVLYTHKISHARRDRTPLVIRRHGFHFDEVPAVPAAGEEARDERMSALQAKIVEHVIAGLSGMEKVTHSHTGLAKSFSAMGRCPRRDAEAAIEDLMTRGVLFYMKLPKAQGAKREYLVPSAHPELM